jgi:two-component system cell cycle response regulator CpdR
MSHKISLVVDDEPSVRSFIMAVLRSDGFQTFEAEDGVQALELLRKVGTGVDLLVSDINMPNMDGITLASSVRAEFPAIPLILVSGYAEIGQAKRPNTGLEFVQLPFHPATSECSEESDDVELTCAFRMNRNGNLECVIASWQ